MADLSVNNVNLQLSNTINIPNTSTQFTASVNYSRQTHCYQMPVSTPAVYDSLETTHDEQCVRRVVVMPCCAWPLESNEGVLGDQDDKEMF